MSSCKVSIVLAAFALTLAVSTSSLAGPEGTREGESGDEFADFYVNLTPPGHADSDPGDPGSWIDPDGAPAALNGFVFQSASGIFDGPEGADLTGFWFVADTDHEISGNMGNTIDAPWYLGDVVRTSLVSPLASPWTIEDFLDDLTLTYTLESTSGTYYADIIGWWECHPPFLDQLPVLESTWRGTPTVSAQITAPAHDVNEVLTFSLDPELSWLVNPWPEGATITEDGQFSWLAEGVLPGESYDAGVVVTNQCGATDRGVITIDIIPEPSTLALLGSSAVGVLAYMWRQRRR